MKWSGGLANCTPHTVNRQAIIEWTENSSLMHYWYWDKVVYSCKNWDTWTHRIRMPNEVGEKQGQSPTQHCNMGYSHPPTTRKLPSTSLYPQSPKNPNSIPAGNTSSRHGNNGDQWYWGTRKSKKKISKEIKSSIRKDRKSYYEKIVDDLTAADECGNARQMFNAVKRLTSARPSRCNTVKDHEGKLITDYKLKIEAWAAHFRQ